MGGRRGQREYTSYTRPPCRNTPHNGTHRQSCSRRKIVSLSLDCNPPDEGAHRGTFFAERAFPASRSAGSQLDTVSAEFKKTLTDTERLGPLGLGVVGVACSVSSTWGGESSKGTEMFGGSLSMARFLMTLPPSMSTERKSTLPGGTNSKTSQSTEPVECLRWLRGIGKRGARRQAPIARQVRHCAVSRRISAGPTATLQDTPIALSASW